MSPNPPWHETARKELRFEHMRQALSRFGLSNDSTSIVTNTFFLWLKVASAFCLK